MEFPITGVSVDPIYLAGIGFLVGVMGGFFGVGGGFIAGPLLFWTGVPFNFVVGTDLAHMTGKSIVAAKRHHALGHVDFKLGILMVAGTLPGIELGAQLIERLKATGLVDTVIGIAYVVTLLLITLFTAVESVRALRIVRQSEDKRDVLAFQGLATRFQQLRWGPYVTLKRSGIKRISIWSILGVGFVSGFLAGALGVGGGFIRMPMLIYFIGAPTHVAIGTDLFEIIISAGFGTLTHALKGNVDIIMALIMHTGAAIGAQIGAVATRYVRGPHIRLIFSLLPLLGAILVILRLLGIADIPE